MQKVAFDGPGGVRLSGHLYLPASLSALAPAVVTIGPMTYAKEQAPTEYARRLAGLGFVVLAFDCRYRGESGGEPRCLEDPMAKVEDVRSAVAFLAARPEVDADRIVGLGVCQGSSEMLRAAADDDRIKVLSTVAGHYRDREGDVAWLTEDGLAKRREQGEAAREKYDRTGEVEYVPAVDPERTDAGMPGKFVWEWYHHWSDRGVWENRYAVMSDAALLAYESISAASRLRQPYLMIHSDNSFLPDAARRHFEAVPGADKELFWDGDKQHFQYYDDPTVLDSTVSRMADFYRSHLG